VALRWSMKPARNWRWKRLGAGNNTASRTASWALSRAAGAAHPSAEPRPLHCPNPENIATLGLASSAFARHY
jgi:hypothetical protein